MEGRGDLKRYTVLITVGVGRLGVIGPSFDTIFEAAKHGRPTNNYFIFDDETGKIVGFDRRARNDKVG